MPRTVGYPVANGLHCPYGASMLRVQIQPAYVLHTRAYRESSHLLELLTRDYGRVAAVARGSRGPRSRWKNILQPFRPLLVSWSQRGDLGTLSSADQVAAPPALPGSALYCGLYLNELLIRLLHRNDPHPEVFERYRDALGLLATGQDPQPTLRVFEKHLLQACGFGVSLDVEAGSERPISATEWYDYQPAKGAIRAGTGAQRQSGIVPGQALLALDSEQLSADDLPYLKDLMRRVIRHHLGDKPLASESLYRSMRSGADRKTTRNPS